MEDRWDVMGAFCIKEYETLKPNNFYQIKGRGNLDFNCDPKVNGKKGYGLCVEDNNGNLCYFTIKEMDEYFSTEDKQYERNKKLKKLLK